jgi:hypothetical protein
VNGVNESFPSNRKYFAAYNYNHKDARINDLIKMLADSGRVAYSLPFISPASMKDSSREARIFNDKTNFPYFIASNNIDDQTNIDPNFVDKTIYSLKDSAVAWSYPSSEYVLGLSYPTQDTWPHYYVAPDSEIGYPVKWPRINGTYQNSQLMAGSIEGLPLGDLNWFPDKKAIWQAHQTEVMNHILNENISVINITSVKKSDNQVPNQFSLSQNYPNPFNPTTQIRYSISKNSLVTLKVYNLLGQEVTTLVNQQQKSGNYTVNFNASKLASGIYMYKIQAGEFSLTKKMTLLK